MSVLVSIFHLFEFLRQKKTRPNEAGLLWMCGSPLLAQERATQCCSMETDTKPHWLRTRPSEFSPLHHYRLLPGEIRFTFCSKYVTLTAVWPRGCSIPDRNKLTLRDDLHQRRLCSKMSEPCCSHSKSTLGSRLWRFLEQNTQTQVLMPFQLSWKAFALVTH